jgi:RES domain-containing protein
MQIWRISNFSDLSGAGGKYAASRWNRVGHPVVYCADHPSTSLLETLVHIDKDGVPPSYQLLAIEVPDTANFYTPALPKGWESYLGMSQEIGTKFLIDLQFPLMRIPSYIMPQAFNYLINPVHPDAAAITIAQTWRYPFDSRLLI